LKALISEQAFQNENYCVLSTVLALLALSDVITIRAFLALEQLFAIMRIAAIFISFNNCTERFSFLKPFIENSLTPLFLLQDQLKYKLLIGFKLILLAIAPSSKH